MQSQIFLRKLNCDSRKEDVDNILNLIKKLDYSKYELVIIFKELECKTQTVPQKKYTDQSPIDIIHQYYSQFNIAYLKNQFALCKVISNNIIQNLNSQIQKQKHFFLKLLIQNKQINQAKKFLQQQTKSSFYDIQSTIQLVFSRNTQKQRNYLLKLLDLNPFQDVYQPKQYLTLSKSSKFFKECSQKSNETFQKINWILNKSIVKDDMAFEKILLQGEIQTRRGECRKAVEILESIEEQKLNKGQKSRYNYLLGINYIFMKQYKMAFEIFKILFANIEQQRSKMKKILIKYYYSICLEKFNKLDQAEKSMRQLYFQARFFLHSSNIIILQISQLFAQILFKQRKYQQSKNIYLVVVDLYQNFPEIQKLALGKTFNNLATVYTQLNDHNGASTYYQMALKIFKQQNCKAQYIQRVQKNLRYNQKKKQLKSKQ